MEGITNITSVAVNQVSSVTPVNRAERAISAYTDTIEPIRNERPGVQVSISDAGRAALAQEQEQLELERLNEERLELQRQQVLDDDAFNKQLEQIRLADFVLAAQKYSLFGLANAPIDRRYDVDEFEGADNRVLRTGQPATANYYGQTDSGMT